MPIAAVPKYLGQNFKDASPGLRFGMYLKLWGVNKRTNALLWTTHDVVYVRRGQDKQEREDKNDNKEPCLREAKVLTEHDQKTLSALLARQQDAFDRRCHAGLHLTASATAPFTTGLGNEHPLQNGFAFLNPYGLPYLPGSGVKGVVRRAAQELAGAVPGITWDNDRGWKGLHEKRYKLERGKGKSVDLSVLDVLFGREPPQGDSDHVRGALCFWDVIPQIQGDKLMVEIMTPHQSHYYQQKNERESGASTTPHDSGQPSPITFLTVPPGSEFHFFVTCDEAHLERLTGNPPDGAWDLFAEDGGKKRWERLIEAAFEHAFEWLGFGAKTAVGYGAMRRDTKAEKTNQEMRERREREARLAQMSPQRRQVEEFIQYARQELEKYPNRKPTPVGGQDYQKAQALAKAAQGADWSPDDKAAAAKAIEEWGPKLINIERKVLRKKLNLDALEGR